MPRHFTPIHPPLTGDPHGPHCSAGFADDGPGARLPVALRRGCQLIEIDLNGGLQ